MKKFIVVIAIVLLTASAHAQIVDTIVSQQHDLSFSAGREFWYAAQSNYWGEDLGGKYIQLYITSPKSTTAYVEYQGTRNTVPITANTMSTFKVPNSWELESSGIVENKAIHIYSPDAPLIVYNLSHQPYTSDGEYLIPTIGWGTDYVVAAYGSLFEGFGTYVYDLPSTCAIVSDEDSTQVSVTPSVNCRQCTSGTSSGNSASTVVVYNAGVTYSFTMNRGQSLEFMPTKSTDPDNFDLTGTIIHANHPIGVLGGSVCPNIPADFPYCDHVEDMTPPVRTWGKTYYTNYYPQQKNAPDIYCRYLFIASQPNQTIHRENCSSGDVVECTIPNQFGIYWDELPNQQKFFSDAPFLCVEYINSESYPDGGQDGQGSPAEANVTPYDRFIRTVQFEFATTVGNENAYTNSINITVNDSDIKKTLLDGKVTFPGIPAQCLEPGWSIFTVMGLSTGSHIITGDDSGIGVQASGYGYDESYAWSTESFEGTQGSPDHAPPVATVTANCSNTHIAFADTGTNSSRLATVWIDSISNMEQTSSDTGWYEGIPFDSTSFDFSAQDLDTNGYLSITAYDFAGNSTRVIVRYNKPGFTASSANLNFGTVPIGTKITIYDTITDLSTDPIPLDTIFLLNGKMGFEIDSAIITPLQPGSLRIIKLSFTAGSQTTASDMLKIVNACDTFIVALSGSGGTPASVSTQNGNAISAYLETTNGRDVRAVLPVSWEGTVHIELTNTLGERVFEGSISATNPYFDASVLPRDTYFYTLACGWKTQTGKIVLVE